MEKTLEELLHDIYRIRKELDEVQERLVQLQKESGERLAKTKPPD